MLFQEKKNLFLTHKDYFNENMAVSPIPNTYFHLFYVIKKILFIFGLDITNNDDKITRHHFFYQKAISFMWIIFIIVAVVSFTTIDIHIGSNVQSMLFRKSSDISTFLIWSVMKTRENAIYSLLHDMNTLRYVLGIRIPSFWIWLIVALIFAVPLLAWLSVVVFLDEEDCKRLVLYYSFKLVSVSDGYYCRISGIILFLSCLLIHTLRTTVTILYIAICCLLRSLLKKHSEMGIKKLEKKINAFHYKRCQNYVDFYKHVTEISNSFEKVMSLPVFLIIIGDCLGMFYGFLKYEDTKRSMEFYDVNYRFAILFLALRSLVSFLCVAFAAASVYESSKDVKKIQEKLTESLLASGEKIDNQQLFLLLLAQSNPPTVLSAWGFFNFKRNLVISVFGIVLTYSLLMIQIMN
ncbi:uncharacterized protein TNIN_368791 [Trichonephila inaurata madagascariensis]|uniref:Gustatory receptor n=1 Tax=Trichonephila inaurata madagascariensis TaxID=2747483 RepID=A0A8X6XSY6_9ARAC|nr:uncharacterized protein TNIN_368791 [Trichonephila inaurata madagascariensis]